jgi:tetratricopeptide (TPR) repeat protein
MISSPMLPALEPLTRAELVRRLDEPELTYIFKHALVQDTAYSTLLRNERRRLHQRVAEALEQNFPQERDALAATLSEHYWQCEVWDKVVEYALRAGANALRVYALRETLEHYERALAALKQMASPSPLQEFEALMGWAEAALNYRPYAEQLEKLARAEQIARELDDKPRLARALYFIGRVHSASGHNLRAGQPLMECFALADEIGDERLTIIPTYFMGLITSDGNPREAIPLYERAIELAQRFGDQDTEALAWTTKGWAHAKLGEFVEARAAVARGQQLLARVKSPMAASDVDLFAGWSYFDMGDPQSGLEYGQRGVNKAMEAENMDCVCGGFVCVGFNRLAAQQLHQAADAFREAIHHSQYSGAEMFENLGRAGLAMAQFYSGHSDVVGELEKTYTRAHAMEDVYSAPLIAEALGEMFTARGEFERAEFYLQDALAFYRPRQMKPYVTRSLEALARLYEQLGRGMEAEQARAEAASMKEILRES